MDLVYHIRSTNLIFHEIETRHENLRFHELINLYVIKIAVETRRETKCSLSSLINFQSDRLKLDESRKRYRIKKSSEQRSQVADVMLRILFVKLSDGTLKPGKV